MGRSFSIVLIGLAGLAAAAQGAEPPTGALKPATLLLEERAALAINCLAQNQDPQHGGEPYFLANVESVAPDGYGVRAIHQIWDFGDCPARFAEALLMARIMSGSQAFPEADSRLWKLVLSCIREDGLAWMPETNACDIRVNMVSGWTLTGTTRALATRYLTQREPDDKRILDQMIAGMGLIAVKQPDYWYWPELYYQGKWSNTAIPVDPTGSGYEWGTPILGLARYYEETKDPQAKEMIEKSARFVIERSGDFAPDGSYPTWHTHGRTLMAAGILRYAILEGKQDWVKWAKGVYDYTHDKLGKEFGWVPERQNSPDTGSETCTIADMVDLAIQLAESGDSRYWNHVERIVRNHLVESQITDIGSLKPIPADLAPPRPPSGNYKGDWRDCTRTGGAAEMQLGGFAGRSAPNDVIAGDPSKMPQMMIQHCCTGHGTRALYLAWHHIVTKRPDAVYVNMALSRDTPWVEVNSYHPYQGKLEIVVHDAPDLAVRVADWAIPEDVQVTVDDQPVPVLTRKRNYVVLAGLKPGARVVVSYPLRSTSETVKIGSHQYTVEWRGDTVVSIDPPGKILPLYRRESMKTAETPLKEIHYHVPQNEIDW